MMPIHSHTCFSATCDTPGCDPWDAHDGIPHFETEAKAIAQLTDPHGYGWTLTDGVLRCRGCSAAHQCELEGHLWAHYRGDPALRLAQEYCTRCDDDRLVATQTT